MSCAREFCDSAQGGNQNAENSMRSFIIALLLAVIGVTAIPTTSAKASVTSPSSNAVCLHHHHHHHHHHKK
jgi:hypothetical protein